MPVWRHGSPAEAQQPCGNRIAVPDGLKPMQRGVKFLCVITFYGTGRSPISFISKPRHNGAQSLEGRQAGERLCGLDEEGMMPREAFQSCNEKKSATRAARTNIGRQLRANYAPDLAKPLPQRLVELLRRLAERDDKAPC